MNSSCRAMLAIIFVALLGQTNFVFAGAQQPATLFSLTTTLTSTSTITTTFTRTIVTATSSPVLSITATMTGATMVLQHQLETPGETTTPKDQSISIPSTESLPSIEPKSITTTLTTMSAPALTANKTSSTPPGSTGSIITSSIIASISQAQCSSDASSSHSSAAAKSMRPLAGPKSIIAGAMVIFLAQLL